MRMSTATVPTLATGSLSTVSRRLRRGDAARARAGESLLHYLAVSLSAALLVLILAIAAAVIGVPALVGGSAMTVLTQSMEPNLPPGTLVVIRPTPVDEIEVGDVITYQIRSGEAAVVSHRVISKTYAEGEVSFLTQGDNNDAPDPDAVQPLQIRGTLWYSLPMLGWVNNVFNGANRALVIGAAAGVLFLYAAGMVFTSIRERRRAAAAAAAAAPAGAAASGTAAPADVTA
jgi:signal peptidase